MPKSIQDQINGLIKIQAEQNEHINRIENMFLDIPSNVATIEFHVNRVMEITISAENKLKELYDSDIQEIRKELKEAVDYIHTIRSQFGNHKNSVSEKD